MCALRLLVSNLGGYFTAGTVACRLLYPWDFSSLETGVGCHCLLQGICPGPGVEPRSPALQADSLPTEPPGKLIGYIGVHMVFPDSSAGKESACNAGNPGLIPGSGRSPGEGISYLPTPVLLGFFGASGGKESACNAGDLGSTPELGRSPGGGHGNLLQYSSVHGEFHGQRSLVDYSPWGRKESDKTEQLSTAQA